MMEHNDQNKSDEAVTNDEPEVETYQGTDAWALVERLEADKQRDPQVAIQLVSVYEQVLEQVIPNSSLYASMQTNLGLAYSDLPTGDRTDNLKKAISCYQEALRVWTPETEPLKYARTQTNLGNAYNELPTGDHAANQSIAITCFREALRFLTPETAPFEYAATQVNLGNAYSELQADDRTANLKQAIASYQEALRIWTPETAPFEYAAVQTFLVLQPHLGSQASCSSFDM